MSTDPVLSRTLCTLAFSGLALFLASCSKPPETPEAPKPSADIHREGTRTVVTDAGTGARLILGATDIPEDFPLDLPVFPDATLRSHFTTHSTLFTTFLAAENVETLRSFFLEGDRLPQLGWEVRKTGEQGGAVTIDLRKGGRRAMITLKSAPDSAGTNIAYVARVE